MIKPKKSKTGKPINFILTDENQRLMEEYKKNLPPGTDIKPSIFFNEAIKSYLNYFLYHS